MCFYESESNYKFIPIPLKKTSGGKLGYCDIQLTEIFKSYMPITYCVFEAITMPPDACNAQAINTLKEQQGFFKGLCRGLNIPFTCCGALAWQNAMFDNWKDGSTKKRSIKASKQFNPEIDLKRTERCTIDDHNMSDAYLMALYAEQQANKSDNYFAFYK
jgi:hypothetical protein